ncbi:MAG: TIGR01777 family protein [Armatimonadota bacterium]
MRVAITGATGLLGGALARALEGRGHTVLRLSRSREKSALAWSPSEGFHSLEAFESFDALVHLAGESIVGRWTEEKKRRIRDSRVVSTAALASQIARAAALPKVFVCASAVGYYGDRGDEVLTEESPPGEGFLAQVGVEWESAALEAERSGVRVALLRTAVVLSEQGGALEVMARPFQFGLGAVLGSGKQFLPWVSLNDWVRLAVACIEEERWVGPVNVASPNPVRNREFSYALGAALRRPVLLRVPAFALRLLLGEMADEGLLLSQRVVPKRAQGNGFEFEDVEIRQTLARLVG